MLSILIPNFNYLVEPLLEDLLAQCERLGLPFEILCFDDASDAIFRPQKPISDVNNRVKISLLEKNIGRSKIRNLLAASAIFPNLLFMDCDMSVAQNPNFIQNYVAAQQDNPTSVLLGGRIYEQKCAPNKILHWKNGSLREVKTAAERSKNSYSNFISSSFILPKNIFQSIRFDENLTQYGHEDTLFGLILEQQKISILHLDNPSVHLGLEDTSIFLEKTKFAIENLVFLNQRSSVAQTKLTKTVFFLKKYALTQPTRLALAFALPTIENHLNTSPNPRLFVLDLFKLHYFLTFSRR